MRRAEGEQRRFDLYERIEQSEVLAARFQVALKAHFKKQRQKLEELGARASALHGAVMALGESRLSVYYRLRDERTRLQALEETNGPESSEFKITQEVVNELTEQFERIEADYAVRTMRWSDAARLYEACKLYQANAEADYAEAFLAHVER